MTRLLGSSCRKKWPHLPLDNCMFGVPTIYKACMYSLLGYPKVGRYKVAELLLDPAIRMCMHGCRSCPLYSSPCMVFGLLRHYVTILLRNYSKVPTLEEVKDGYVKFYLEPRPACLLPYTLCYSQVHACTVEFLGNEPEKHFHVQLGLGPYYRYSFPHL